MPRVARHWQLSKRTKPQKGRLFAFISESGEMAHKPIKQALEAIFLKSGLKKARSYNHRWSSMEDKALYILAKFDGATQDIFTGYYNMLSQNGLIGSQTKGIPYHFTLGSRSVDCELQTIIDFEKICSNTSSFKISLAYLGLFGLNVLFISPNMNFELLGLQSSFFPDSGYGCHSWAPHATLLIDEPEIIQKAVPIVAENFTPFKGEIESVALYEFFPMRLICDFSLNRA